MHTPFIKNQTLVRHVTMDDSRQLANLIHFEYHVHRHLDWRAPLEWIGHSPYIVLEQKNNIVAAFACPPDPPEVAWIRLFAISRTVSIEPTWNVLWTEALEQLASLDQLQCVAAIPLWPWFTELLDQANFFEANRVLMLSWEPGHVAREDKIESEVIRLMNFDDIPAVTEVDAISFESTWRNSQENLELAFRQAALATVIEENGKIIAYQISTTTPAGGHLARLAVLPEYQGKGMGRMLLNDLLTQFERRGAHQVTVNTQADNIASLHLYQRAGFFLTGEEYPLMRYEVN